MYVASMKMIVWSEIWEHLYDITEREVKNDQYRDTCNIGQQRHRTKTLAQKGDHQCQKQKQSNLQSCRYVVLSDLHQIARWLETSFPKFNRHEYYTAVSYIIRLGNAIIFLITSDVLDRKLNKENQIFIFSSFFNEKGILIEIWYSMNFCVKNVFFLPLTLISEKQKPGNFPKRSIVKPLKLFQT
jgi:hypothetical protein